VTTIDLLQAIAAALNVPLSTVLLWVSITSGIASPLASLLPRPAPDSRWVPWRNLLDKLAWNFANASNAPAPIASPHPIVGTSAAPIAAIVLTMLGLSACTTAQLQTEATRVAAINTIICKTDAAAQPVLVSLGSTIAVAVNPADAPVVAGAVALDAAAHKTLQDACPVNSQLLAAVAAGQDPNAVLASVSTSAAPIAADVQADVTAAKEVK